MTQDMADPAEVPRAGDSAADDGPIDNGQIADAPVQDEGDSVGASFARLYADGRAYADAEIDRQKLRVGIVTAAVRDAAILGVVAMMLFFVALVALAVGLVLALAPMIGVLLATFVVFGGAVLLVALLLLLAKGRIGRMSRDLKA